MLSFRKLMLIAIGITCILLLPQIAVADPIHSHCATRTWTLTRNPAVTIANEPADPDLFTIIVGGVQFDQLPEIVPNCVYESSDITSITITLNFTNNNNGVITTSMVQGFRSPPGLVSRNFLPIPQGLTYTFGNGQVVQPTIQFTIHTAGDAFHVIPGNLFGVNLVINENQRPQPGVTATLSASGNHYYQPVPEPATMFLLGTGLVGVAIKMRKRLKRRNSGQGSP